MDIFNPGSATTVWLILCLVHIVLSYIGARRLLKLEIDEILRMLWLAAIFLVPYVGILTFFVIRPGRSQFD